MLVLWWAAEAYRGTTPPRGESHPESAVNGQEATVDMHLNDVFATSDQRRKEMLDFVTRDRQAGLASDQSRRAGRRPQPLPGFGLAIALVIAAMFGLTAQLAASGAAQADPPAATGGNSFVGGWRFTDLNFDVPSLATFTADGNVFVSNLPVEPVPPELDVQMLLLSPGVGVWETAGEDRAAFTYVYLYADETGTFQSSATLSGMLEIAEDGQALSGEYAFEVREPEGTVVHSYTGTVEGTRIDIIPMAEMNLPAS
jgi:hypothetical protein